MPVNKCNNCGATIPAGAAFCPSCGAPKAVEQQPSQPVQMVYQQNRSAGFDDIFKMVFSRPAIVIGVGLGILLAWIGVLIGTFASGSANVATLLGSMGFAGMGFLLIGAGVVNNNIDKFVRLGMVVIGGYMVASALSSSSIFGLLRGITG